MNDDITIGDIIRDELLKRDLFQRDLSYITGINEQHLSNIIKGRRHLTPKIAYKLGKALDLLPYYLMEVATKQRLKELEEKIKN